MTVLPQAEIVEVDALWKTIVAAIAAGVGITVASLSPCSASLGQGSLSSDAEL